MILDRRTKPSFRGASPDTKPPRPPAVAGLSGGVFPSRCPMLCPSRYTTMRPIGVTVIEDQPGEIRPGDIYEDCSFHPVLCTYVDGDEIGGISLIDATAPRACSLGGCGVIKLSIADVVAARDDWSAHLASRKAEYKTGGSSMT